MDQVGIGVALDHRQPLRHAGIHPGLAQLDAAAVDTALLGQQTQQRAVAATDIEHPRARADHLGDQQQVDAARVGVADRVRRDVEVHGSHPSGPAMPRFSAPAPKKPRMVSNSSGSCSRNES